VCLIVVAIQDRVIYQPSLDVIAPDRAGVSVILIKTEDGETLHAWWSRPAPGKPVFLYLGGNGDRPEIEDGRWRRITERGAGFLALSYRGYSGSTGRPSELGLYADARAAYAWLMANGVTSDDVVIHGFSLGTGPATHLAAERKARALVLEAPFTSLDDLMKDRLPLLPWRWVLLTHFPNSKWIKSVHEPVLIVHGDADSVVPFAEGKRLYALAPRPKEFETMAGSDHATLTRDGLYDRIWQFLADVDAGRLNDGPAIAAGAAPK
jgi:fermentation-respiration switch protein FrsA (DUF1100 family)